MSGIILRASKREAKERWNDSRIPCLLYDLVIISS